MDARREQCEGGFKMSAYKDKAQGTWYFLMITMTIMYVQEFCSMKRYIEPEK